MTLTLLVIFLWLPGGIEFFFGTEVMGMVSFCCLLGVWGLATTAGFLAVLVQLPDWINSGSISSCGSFEDGV